MSRFGRDVAEGIAVRARHEEARKAREAAGFTQRQTAAAAGVTQATVSHGETGARAPSDRVMKALGRAVKSQREAEAVLLDALEDVDFSDPGQARAAVAALLRLAEDGEGTLADTCREVAAQILAAAEAKSVEKSTASLVRRSAPRGVASMPGSGAEHRSTLTSEYDFFGRRIRRQKGRS